MKIRNFANLLEANGINRPTGFFAKKSFDMQWQKAEESYNRLASGCYERNRDWQQISEELKAAWGYQVPSLVEVEGFVNPRFHTPAEAVKVCNQKLRGLNATNLCEYESDLIDDFHSMWNAEIAITAKSKDSALVVIRKAKGQTPSLDKIKEFTDSVNVGKEAVIEANQIPVWVACSPENVKNYLDFFTRNNAIVEFK